MRELWEPTLIEFWNLIDEKQKIAYLDAAISNPSNHLPMTTALIALNDNSEEVRVAALAAAAESCIAPEFDLIAGPMFFHPNWYIRETALRLCEKFQLCPGAKLIVQLYPKYLESIPRLCEIQDSWRVVVNHCFNGFAGTIWNICDDRYPTHFVRYNDGGHNGTLADSVKAACVRSEELLGSYKAYCWIYEQWAERHPDAATQSVEEQAAYLLFKGWLERYADANQSTEAAAEA